MISAGTDNSRPIIALNDYTTIHHITPHHVAFITTHTLVSLSLRKFVSIVLDEPYAITFVPVCLCISLD